MSIERILKEKYPLYLQGKTERVINAAIEYLESPYALTQEEVAKKHGCSPQALRKRVHEICKLLNIDIDVLFSRKSLPPEKLKAYEKSKPRSTCMVCKRALGYPRYKVCFLPRSYENFGKVVGNLCPQCFKKFLEVNVNG
jgi:DNA-binding XRE family transcriptional regulator